MKKLQEEDASAPFWLLTMGDMNNLLMVFFIMLFSMLTTDKVKYLKISDDLQSMALTGKDEKGTSHRDMAGETAAKAFEAVAAKNVAATEIVQIRGHSVRLQRLEEGTALTLGSSSDPFDEGDWSLKESHKEVLDVVKKYLLSRRMYVEIRGHTSGNPRDSVILETGSDGQVRVRKITPQDLGADALKVANWSMLGWLRANEVRKYLLEMHPERGDGVVLKEDWLRVRSDGWTKWLVPASDMEDPKQRAVNHRVEVVLTNEEARK